MGMRKVISKAAKVVVFTVNTRHTVFIVITRHTVFTMSDSSDITLQELKAALSDQDESFCWHTISQYPEMMSHLPLKDLRNFAIKAAMFCSVMAIEAGRRNKVTDDVLRHIVLELLPRCTELKLVYDGGNGEHGVHQGNGVH